MNEELRQLDLEVAERVMGFQWFHCVAGTGVERNQFCSKEQEETWRGVGWQLTAIPSPPPTSEFNDMSGCPLYSSDISAAMQAVEKMYADEWEITIYRSVVIEDDWSVEFARPERSAGTFGKTLPEAICRAALTAVNETNPNNTERSDLRIQV